MLRVSSDLVPGLDGRQRCPWALATEQMCAYHDEEWAQPVRGDRALFERLCLEAFQAGLSWRIVLERREGLRMAFAGFDPEVVRCFGPAQVEELLSDARVIRNRAKIAAVISNAQVLLRLHEAMGVGALEEIIWSRHEAGRDRPSTLAEIPGSTPASTGLAKQLRSLGFRFVGPTTAYALMHATGVVDYHLVGCFAARPLGSGD